MVQIDTSEQYDGSERHMRTVRWSVMTHPNSQLHAERECSVSGAGCSASGAGYCSPWCRSRSAGQHGSTGGTGGTGGTGDRRPAAGGGRHRRPAAAVRHTVSAAGPDTTADSLEIPVLARIMLRLLAVGIDNAWTSLMFYLVHNSIVI